MKKNIVMIGIMLVLALVLIRGTKIQSVDEYYLTHMEDIQEDSETVTISIKCDTLRQPENWEKLNKQLKDRKICSERWCHSSGNDLCTAKRRYGI